MTHCTRKVRDRRGRVCECRRPAQTIYTVEGEEYPLCRKHDSAAAHALADERGYGVKEATWA